MFGMLTTINQVAYAARYEYACHVKDFIARRTRVAFLNVQAARECVPRVSDVAQLTCRNCVSLLAILNILDQNKRL